MNFSFDMLVMSNRSGLLARRRTALSHDLPACIPSSNNVRLRLRVPLNGNAPHLRHVEKVYPNANWYEREVWDLFGIRFEGHSDLRRIVMPHDWEGHPLRKDYPLGYEEVQFTFNFDEINTAQALSERLSAGD